MVMGVNMKVKVFQQDKIVMQIIYLLMVFSIDQKDMSWVCNSFDDLDELEKNIFLDIAILFEGTSEKDVKKFLSCCYKGVVCGISNLIDKYLLVRSYFGLIDMHDMLQEMGKDIVRQESMDPGRHSRLWKAKDVYQVLRYNNEQSTLKSLTVGGVSLVELPCLNHLASLKELELSGCHNLKTFPEVPKHFPILELSETKIKEVPDSIEHLVGLQKLCLKNSKVNILSSNISKLESLRHLNLSHCPMIEFPEIPRSLRELDLSGTQIKEATLSIDSLNNLQRLEMDHCESLKILSELPPYMRNLDARGCTSLEKVSFTDQISYQLDPNDDDDDWFLMIFCNCISLNQDSIENIEANAMLKFGYLAEKQRVIWEYPYFTNKFEHQSTSSSLVLKIAPKGSNGSRFLVFSICLVVDLTLCYYHEYLTFYCECQFKTGSGGDYETFRSQWKSFLNEDSNWRYMGDHVLILFSKNMVKQDKDYEEASFEFYIQNLPSSEEEDEEDEEETEDENIKVEKCGVHVSYVDEETSTTPTT
uniref:Disease resistance protein Roq1-like winged-helix domain-containing protein n=1 Tax=Gossypium raimondii TaxID=29730 RepID=A0A0D2RU15_GOSRA|nr:hypothetical protein B456_011G282600 [Gossypium raimondii]KJB74247.1 hypothetical protein B456_011G282600 [Gossypium raimondii]